MSAILVKMPPAMRSAAAPSDSPMAKPMKHGARVVAGDEEQDAQHDEQLDADEQHADAHARLERDRVDGIGLAPEAREGGARVGERVDADAEPRHAVAARDADQAEEQDDDDLDGLEVQQEPEVEDDDDADEDLEDQDELALGDQVRLAGLVDQLGDLPHRLVHGQVLELAVDDEAEDQPEDADDEAASCRSVRPFMPTKLAWPRSGTIRFASPPPCLAGAATAAAGAPGPPAATGPAPRGATAGEEGEERAAPVRAALRRAGT